MSREIFNAVVKLAINRKLRGLPPLVPRRESSTNIASKAVDMVDQKHADKEEKAEQTAKSYARARVCASGAYQTGVEVTLEMKLERQEAERLALAFLGPGKRVEFCECLPKDGLYFGAEPSELHARYLVFSVFDDPPYRMGASQYVGVSKTTGQVAHLGQSGE